MASKFLASVSLSSRDSGKFKVSPVHVPTSRNPSETSSTTFRGIFFSETWNGGGDRSIKVNLRFRWKKEKVGSANKFSLRYISTDDRKNERAEAGPGFCGSLSS